MHMNKKWVILISIIVFLLVIAVWFTNFSAKKKQEDRDYELLGVNECKYYLLSVEGKFGVIGKDGNVVIEPVYEEVQIPNQDRAIFIVRENDQYMVLNENNIQIFNDIGDVSAILGKDLSGQIIFNNTVLKYRENDKYGLVDFEGKKITEPLYDEISSLDDKYGEILVKKDDKYGVINVKGVNLVSIKYDFVKGDGYELNGSYKNSGFIIGNRINGEMKYGYMDSKGKEIVKLEQESLYRVTEINSNDVYLVASQNGRYALYKNKENLTSYKYIAMYYNNGTNTFTVQKNKSYGLINLSGEVVIPEEYEQMMVVGIYVKAHKNDADFTFDLSGNRLENSQFASLQLTTTEKFYISIDDNYKYGIADRDKNVVIENKYDYIDEVEDTGILIATVDDDVTIYSANVTQIVSIQDANVSIEEGYIKVSTGKDFYYLTVNGKKVDNKTVYLDNNIYASKYDNKWGFVDLRNNIIVPYIYDEVTEINKFGFAGVKTDGKWGVINSNGEVILEPTYESDVINPVFIGRYVLKNNVFTDEI